MMRLTKTGKSTLDKEVERYREYIIERAENYASQDDSIDITEKHVIKAANDFQNDMFVESQKRATREERRKKSYFTLLAMILCVVFLVFIVVLSFYDLREGGQKHASFISLLSGVMTVFVMAITMSELRGYKRKGRKDGEGHKQIVLFLNKWNEAESLLKNLYRKKNHKEAGTIKELLLFYKDLPSVQENGKEEAIHSLLIVRNNLVHRSAGGVKVETITRLNKEMDEVLELLKNSN